MEEVVESAIWCKAKGALLVGMPPPGNDDSLCNRVYPNDTCIGTLANGNGVDCGEGCHMN